MATCRAVRTRKQDKSKKNGWQFTRNSAMASDLSERVARHQKMPSADQPTPQLVRSYVADHSFISVSAQKFHLDPLLLLFVPWLSWVFSEGDIASVAVVISVTSLAWPSSQGHATVEQGRDAHGPFRELQPRGGKSLTHAAPLELLTSSPQFHVVAKSHLRSSVRPPSVHPFRIPAPAQKIRYRLPSTVVYTVPRWSLTQQTLPHAALGVTDRGVAQLLDRPSDCTTPSHNHTGLTAFISIHAYTRPYLWLGPATFELFCRQGFLILAPAPAAASTGGPPVQAK